MKISYLVHGRARPEVSDEGEVRGETVKVIVPITEIELVDDAGKHGSITLRFRTKAEQEYAAARFVPGQRVEIDFGDAPKAEPAAEQAA